MSLVISKVFTYDTDAGNYIQAVEGPAGDNQALEPAVRQAINNFVVGCKQDGIWSAIKASCILAGARTFAGALIPLKGTAPNKFGTEGNWNYNRKTGLQGDGSTNYLNSNRSNDPLNGGDPQDNKHLSVYQSSVALSDSILIGTNNGTGRSALVSLTAGGISARINSITNASVVGNGIGFVGGSRSTPGTSIGRVNGTNFPQAINSETPANLPIGVFASGSGVAHAGVRLAFYSIGESLDLAKLDSRVTDLIAAFNNPLVIP